MTTYSDCHLENCASHNFYSNLPDRLIKVHVIIIIILNLYDLMTIFVT